MANRQYNNNKVNGNSIEFMPYTEEQPETEEFREHDTDYGDDFGSSSPNKHYNVKSAKAKPKKKSRVKAVIITIVVILVLLVLLAGIYPTLLIFRIKYTDEHPDNDSVSESAGLLKSDKDVENILLFGVDNHKEGEYGRSDSMIIISIDKKSNEIKQTSLLRDTYVTIPGYGSERLNAAFSIGGAKLATETIEYNYKLKIDSYIILDYAAFTSIIDSVGGVDIELEEEEIDYINWQCWKNKQVDTRDELDISSYTFTTNEDGENVALVHLNGRQALWHARNRGQEGICSGDDIVRAERQREVIQAMFKKLKSSGIFTLVRVMWDTAPYITTDMSKTDILGKMFSVAGYLGYERTEYSSPRSDNMYFDWENGSSVIKMYDSDYELEKLYSYIYNE